MDVLTNIFNLCIFIGLFIPLLNILTGWFGSLFSVGGDVNVDVDVDFDLDLDAGADTSVQGGGNIPFNIMCLCLLLMVFGATGHMMSGFMTNTLFMVLLLLGCFIAAAFSYWALYTFLIKRLRNNAVFALCYRHLPGKSASVLLRIQGDSMGTISLRDSTGAHISFRAKLDPDLKDQMPDGITKGESVIVTGVDLENKFCYVSLPYSKLQKSADPNE